MKQTKNKGHAYHFSFHKRSMVSCILFFVFLNYCEAQNTQAVLTGTSVNKKLSGIYSSKSSSNSLENNLFDSINLFPSDFPSNTQHYKEEIDKRTFTSRTFNDDNGGVIIKYSSNNLNYLDKENKLQPISAKLSTSPLSPLSNWRGAGGEVRGGGLGCAKSAISNISE